MDVTTEPTTARSSRTRAAKVRRSLGLVCAGAVAFAVLTGCISADQSTVEGQINSARTAADVRTLIDYAPSDTKAQAWAAQLAANGSLSHTNLADGYTPGTWCHLGENVGMGPDLGAIQAAFMASAPHHANIVNPVYDHFGTGVVKSGSYYYVVQEFADLC